MASEKNEKDGPGAPPAPAPPSRPVPLDPMVREAYRKAFGVEPGNITAGQGMGDHQVSVNDPDGKPIRGIGANRKRAFENLIALLNDIA